MKKLTIYTGCMASGKSKALIEAFKNAPLETDVYLFGNGNISSRGADLSEINAINITLLSEIKPTNKNLIIDECQFFCDWAIYDLIVLFEHYDNVYLAGLDWIQRLGQDFSYTTQFYRNICTELYHFPFEYTVHGLLAKNDITGEMDARISKRKEGATDVRDKSNYINVNFNQAFNK